MNTLVRPKSREAIKAWNREKIIDATIKVITQYGIAGTTIAKVVKLADVSMGLVNVQFKSKEALLYEVASQIAEDYNKFWMKVLENAPNNPADQIRAMIYAEFEPEALNLENMGVWFAFRAQARANPEYVGLVGTREHRLMQKTIGLFSNLNTEGNYNHSPEMVGRAVIAMQEGMWTDYFLYPDNFDRDKAKESIFLFLAALYPKHF